jgi:hypothetical protein
MKNVFKIYFNLRDKFDSSYTGYTGFDIGRQNQIVDLPTKPVLVPGALGAFDDSGTMAVLEQG